MKISRKYLLAATALLASSLAQADLSANVGYASEYHFRGIFQKTSSASGGLDYESGGFYAGTWAADVGDGLEVDGYFGYGATVGEFDLSIGYNGYFYTGDFDDTYQEIIFGASYGIASFEFAVGTYDGDFDSETDGDQDEYTYAALTIEKDGFYGTLGVFGQDVDADHLEIGYGTTISDIDFGVALIFADNQFIVDDDESLVFTIGKSFDIN